MKQSIAAIALLVRDYDEAIAFYTESLDFVLAEDTPLENGKRWVVVAPPGSSECRLLLAKASRPEEIEQVGKQSGGRVFLFLHTNDFERDYERMRSRSVVFLEEPRREPYGTVAVFQDLYGNKWDLLEPA